MDRLNSVLIGVDFSDSSARALEQGLRLARWNEARAHVFHVVSETRRAYMATDAEAKLDRLMAGSGAGDSVTHEVRTGAALDETLSLVREHAVDLLAIGAFGPLGQFTGNGVGVFAAQCMRHVPCKVLAVHENLRGPYHRVVSAVDFSATSSRALQAAVRLVRQEEGELHVLHVPEDDDDREAAASQMESAVREAVGDAGPVDYECIVTNPGDPGDGIIRYARKIEAHLIALGSRGMTDLQYVLAGNTCDRVLRAVRRSVLVAKPEDFVPPADR